MTQDLETLLTELIEASPGGRPPHPEPALLLRYCDRELDLEEAAAVREHLVVCRACTAALVDLEVLEELEEDDGESEGPADYASAAAWRNLQPKLAEEERSAAATPSPHRARRWAPRLAAVLAMAVLGLGIWIAQLSQREQGLEERLVSLEAPQTNPSVLYLDALTRSEGQREDAALPTLTIGRRAMVFLTPPAAPPAEAYRIEIQDVRGTPWLTLHDLELQELGALRLSFIPQPPAPGEHHLLLYAGDAAEPLATHPLQLIAAPDQPSEP